MIKNHVREMLKNLKANEPDHYPEWGADHVQMYRNIAIYGQHITMVSMGKDDVLEARDVTREIMEGIND